MIKLEKYYSINQRSSSVDTSLRYKILYDSLERRKTFIEYPSPYGSGRDITRVTDYYYIGNKAIELQRTLNFDTLRQITTIADIDGKTMQREERIYGGWSGGKYSKSDAQSIRKSTYNANQKVVESILYREGRDTSYHWFYCYEKDSISNSTIRYGHEIKNNKHSKNIIQLGVGNNLSENCNSNCTKRIAINMVELNPLSGNYNVLIENGDTAYFSLNAELKLPNNHRMVTYNTYYYKEDFFSSIIYYYQFNDVYRKETCSWDDGRWKPSAIEEYHFNDDRTIKFKTRTTFRNGEKAYVYNSFTRYEFW